MRGDLLDVVLLVAAALFALSGYRQGFVVGVLSFVGFLGGGVLGAHFSPRIALYGPLAGLPSAVVGLGVVFLAASLGQVLATLVGGLVRDRLTWRPLRQLDAVAGALVSVLSVLLVAWLVGTAVASAPLPALASQVRRSTVIGAVNGAVPAGARSFFLGFRHLVGDSGFPEVFGGLQSTVERPVDPPNPALARSAVVRAARDSVVKVTGIARSCGRRIEGSGFAYAPERIMTNAHVVAGVSAPSVEAGGRHYPATVVLYDPEVDIAVLRVPGLAVRTLGFAGPASSGDSAVVLGYPQDGPFRADAARISATERARGRDIYDARSTTREVYALRGRVKQGNSGGPLLSPAGLVDGVVFAAAADKPDVGYALTAREVAGDASAGRSAVAGVSTQSCD